MTVLHLGHDGGCGHAHVSANSSIPDGYIAITERPKDVTKSSVEVEEVQTTAVVDGLRQLEPGVARG
jgi:hypothetical protein